MHIPCGSQVQNSEQYEIITVRGDQLLRIYTNDEDNEYALDTAFRGTEAEAKAACRRMDEIMSRCPASLPWKGAVSFYKRITP